MARDETARESDRKKSLINRRSYLRLAGAAAASVATFGEATATPTDQDVILEEDFSSGDYEDRFTSTYVQGGNDSISTSAAHGGDSSLKIQIPEGEHHGIDATFDPKQAGVVDENLQELYASFWVKFPSDFYGGKWSSKLPGPRFLEPEGPHAGEPTDGTNGWSSVASFTDEGSDGIGIQYYTYHMEMSTDLPAWGDNYTAATIPRGEWVKIGQYVKLNTVSGGSANSDGKLKMWINDELRVDKQSMQWTLKPERGINYDILVYFGGNEESPEDQNIFIDNWRLAKTIPSDFSSDDGVRKQEGSVLELLTSDGMPTTEYEFTVEGSVSKRTNAGDLSAEGNDSISENGDGTVTVTGAVGNGYGDSYVVDGTVTSMSDLDESLWTLRYDGEEVSRDDLVNAGGPTVDRFEIATSEQLGENRMFSVQWAVSASDAELDTVEVVTAESADDLNFAVTDVAGQSASNWDLFQFPAGTELDVSLRAEDVDGNVTRETKTVTL